MKLLTLLIGIILGYFFANVMAGKKIGERGITKSLIFSIKNYRVHMHHWLISGIILIMLLIKGFYNDLIYGFLTGLIIQGFTYKDFYKIVYKK